MGTAIIDVFMSENTWTAVDRYITDLLVPADPILEAAMKSSDEAGLPAINVTPNQGKLLLLLAQIQGARKILEIGTLGGYSTIWLARSLVSDGQLITLEIDPQCAKVARKNFARAGLKDLIDLRVGPALELLGGLESDAPFDLIFIDADKQNTPEYFIWALKLSRKGTLIIADNVVRNGAVVDPTTGDPNIQGIRRFYELVASEPRVNATAIQTVGSKGYDGFAIIRVLQAP